MQNLLQRIAALERAVRSQRPVAGDNVMVSPGLFGTVIDATGGDGAAYDGPFAATIEPPTEGRENEIHVKILPGRIWAGTTKIDFTGDEFYTSAGRKEDIAYVLSIYYDEGEYSYYHFFKTLESYAQSGAVFAIPLVLIKADGRIVQLQHGDIFIAGRCV